MKKTLSLLICAFLIVVSIPFGAFAETEITESITVIPDFEFPDNSELFAGYVERAFYPEYAFSLWGVSARERLSTVDKYLYDWLKANIENVANGTVESTTFEANSATLSKWTGVQTTFSSDIMNNFFAQFDYMNVLEALLSDCPYELYWFDKTVGYQMGISRIGNTVASVFAVFSVSEGYKAANYNAEDPKVSVGSTVTSAVANAKAIVNKYASLGDYDKLVAYRDEICNLTDYNHDVLEESNPAYGDPWQLIHVFDKDNSTKVVCEGYSKAYQYLCDLSAFQSEDIVCYSVVGTTNGGGHMWNIVTMDDGKNYLVDVTNSDSGTIGQNGGLFLNGLSGSVSGGYNAYLSTTITYLYSDDSKLLWGTDSTSILKISSSDYVPVVVSPELVINTTDRTYNASALTVGNDQADVVYTLENANISDYTISTVWYKDNNGSMEAALDSAPKNAGTYWANVTATNKTDNSKTYSASAKITITPATLDIFAVECEDKVYDGTAAATIQYMSYTGLCGDDDITLTADANFLTAELGEKTQVIITNIVISGSSAGNYKMKNDSYTLNISPVNITSDKVKGDINGNGAVDSIDYTLLKRSYFGTFAISEDIDGDINENGNVDSIDYTLLKRSYFGTYVLR